MSKRTGLNTRGQSQDCDLYSQECLISEHFDLRPQMAFKIQFEKEYRNGAHKRKGTCYFVLFSLPISTVVIRGLVNLLPTRSPAY